MVRVASSLSPMLSWRRRASRSPGMSSLRRCSKSQFNNFRLTSRLFHFVGPGEQCLMFVLIMLFISLLTFFHFFDFTSIKELVVRLERYNFELYINLQCDVDIAPEVAEEEGVTCLPTIAGIMKEQIKIRYLYRVLVLKVCLHL